MKVTTKTGDDQTTFLRIRRPKDDLRVEVLGLIDELLAQCILTNLEIGNANISLDNVIKHLNKMLGNLAVDGLPFESENITFLESFITSNEAYYKDVNGFIQAKTVVAAKYNVLRTRVRTLERRFTSLAKEEFVDSSVMIYLNRLSDYFFVAMLMTNN